MTTRKTTNRFRILNDTDGILATPQSFGSRKEAEQWCAKFRERFRAQGYYLTAGCERISPEEVELRIVPAEEAR
jgi:hypothetical protein